MSLSGTKLAHDLKPANVEVTPNGKVKVLDFGLAKPVETETQPGQDLSHSPTMTRDAATGTGVILGTASYMSPEQARGKPVDKRSDIWAFGCCLFEMLSGRCAFPGTSLAETLDAVIAREPEWEALPAHLPENLLRVLRRSLVKDTRLRLQHIGDARIELGEAPGEAASGGSARFQPRQRFSRLLGTGAALVVGAAVASSVRPATELVAPVRHVEITTQPLFVSFQYTMAISPDGETLAYVSRSEPPSLSRRSTRDVTRVNIGFPRFCPVAGACSFRSRPREARLISTEGGCSPRWSADGRTIFYYWQGFMMAVDVTAEPLFRVSEPRRLFSRPSSFPPLAPSSSSP